MKDKLKKLGVIAAFIVAFGIAIFFHVTQSGNVDDEAVARTEAEEGDVHYFDDEAVALAGEPGASPLMNEAVATLALVNAHRANAGLPALTWNDALTQAALVRAMECAQLFSHTRPNGSAWWTVNSTIMYGENLSFNYFNSASVVAAWMASPTHRANILGPFKTMGVAGYQAPNGNVYFAQEFGY